MDASGIAKLVKPLAFLAIATSAGSAAAAQSGSAPVTVVNPPSQPVPVTGTLSNTDANPVPTLVVNPPSQPVPTQNVGGGAATAVGQTATHVVNLDCIPACFQLSANGTRAPTAFSVPTDQAFVLTDVQWELFGSGRGTGNYDAMDVGVNSVTVTELAALVDGSKNAAGQAHLSGIVAAPGASITISPAFSGGVSAFLQGYLVPPQ